MIILSIFEPFYKFISFILELVVIGTHTSLFDSNNLDKNIKESVYKIIHRDHNEVDVHIYVIKPNSCIEDKDKRINSDCIVYFHCNHAETTMQYTEIYRNVLVNDKNKLKTGWILFEYPGYGRSKGKFTADKCSVFTESALNYAKTKFSGKIILVGHSLGTAIIFRYLQYAQLNNKVDSYDGVVVVCPLEGLLKACQHDPLYASLNTFLPLDTIIESRFNFCGETEILSIKNREILIFDAKNEFLIPKNCGLRLYQKLEGMNKNVDESNIYFCLNYDHQSIIYAKDVWDKIFEDMI